MEERLGVGKSGEDQKWLQLLNTAWEYQQANGESGSKECELENRRQGRN